MMLSVHIDDLVYDVDVPDQLVVDAKEFFANMDKDMDEGFQMNRDWIQNPDVTQRCQFVADKVMDAFEKENEQMIIMMCGYILSRINNAKRLIVDTSGNMAKTEIITE